ncbi:pilus assembly protein [Cereibacter sphaeroides]|uniref:Flp family type IVb pilin n=1 Tax=Cereibacter sphaeroides TaxID=1063 RepID=UPI001F4785ED|nr:pilus assembly protein [Cereibacter sphaeroides]MCE6961247.1 pilus assembly protein [Cereibacter sphaeroides]MCE6970233.1 pilus assembly protein [Cereibacter sphaeroides]MCE6974028.1 pilus assembly protein [Cereibacter sphaeroides]
MKLLNIFKHFRNDEDGAVTVDWVVLTAAIVGLGLLVMGYVKTSLESAATNIQTGITTATTMGTASSGGGSGGGSDTTPE